MHAHEAGPGSRVCDRCAMVFDIYMIVGGGLLYVNKTHKQDSYTGGAE